MAPPKPQLILRVGVTGHRPNRFPAVAQRRVQKELGRVFSELHEAVLHLAKCEQAFFDGRSPELRIVSALAEGTDRIAAECALASGFALDVILPIEPELYLTDFQTPDSKAEFLRLFQRARSRLILPGRRRDESQLEGEAYETAGVMILRQCDLLLAVWDREEPRGRGGTAEIVERAFSSRIPVLLFDANGNGPFLLFRKSTLLGGSSDSDFDQLEQTKATSQNLRDLVTFLAAPPGGEAQLSNEVEQSTTARARAALEKYLREPDRRISLVPPLYPLLVSVFTGTAKLVLRKHRSRSDLEREWRPYWVPLNAISGDFPARVRHIVMKRFACADSLADYYGRLHRSGYVTNFLLAACAVLAGSFRWPALELLLTAAIIANTTAGIYMQWHRRWCDYRQLSEQLRHLRSLALTGSGHAEMPSRAGKNLKGAALWTNWYCRASVRELGVPNVLADSAYVFAAKTAICEGELANQRAYHAANARQMQRVAAVLETVSTAAFWFTLLVCLTQLGRFHLGAFGIVLTVLSVLLPAFGAASFGIRVYGDFEEAAERSTDMEQRLGEIEMAMREHVGSFSELSAMVEQSVLVMTTELQDWAFAYHAKPLTLP